jgi:hypothetical protein
MQSNFEVAIADCEDLRVTNREQSRKIAELAHQSTSGAGPETS